MKDQFGRKIDYLRLSVTDRCNYSCVYCRGAGCTYTYPDHEMTREEILRIVKASEYLGIRKIRLTGGEPLLRNDILDVCRDIHKRPKIRELCITTNGSLIKEYASELRIAGVSKINISLDTLDPKLFSELTGGGHLSSVLEGISACYNSGFARLSINAVTMRSSADRKHINQLVDFAKQNPVDLRFIELMPMADNREMFVEEFLSYSEVLGQMETESIIGRTGTSVVYGIRGSKSTVGFIPALTEPFCSRCSRIRVTSDGKLKTCLHSDDEIDLLSCRTVKELRETIQSAVFRKPQMHTLNSKGISESERPMSRIGG